MSTEDPEMTVTERPGEQQPRSGEADEYTKEYSTQVIREVVRDWESIKEVHLREDFSDPIQQRAFCITHAVSLMNGLHLWKDKDEHLEGGRQVIDVAKVLHGYLVGE